MSKSANTTLRVKRRLIDDLNQSEIGQSKRSRIPNVGKPLSSDGGAATTTNLRGKNHYDTQLQIEIGKINDKRKVTDSKGLKQSGKLPQKMLNQKQTRSRIVKLPSRFMDSEITETKGNKPKKPPPLVKRGRNDAKKM